MSSVVPEGWRARLFGDLAKVINGYAFKGSDFVEKSETSVPIIRMSSLKAGTIDLSDAVYVAKNNVKGLEKFLLNSGDFVFGMSGSISNFAIIKEKDGICYQNQRVGRLSPINASSGFLSQLFLSESVSQQIEGLAAGGAQLNISSSQIENLNILSPPLPEQKKIASILTSVDEMIENTQKQIDKLQDLKKATMNELLTKGIGHTEFKDSELGRIPKSWEVLEAKQIFEFKNGLNKEKEAFGSGQKIVNYMDVFSEPEVDIGKVQGRVQLNESERSRFKVLSGDLFFTRTSETPEEIGLSSVVVSNTEEVCFSGFILRARPTTDVLYAPLSGYLFRSNYVRNQIIGTCSYTTRALTNGNSLGRVRIAIPPNSEQEVIYKTIKSIVDRVVELSKHNEKYKSLKKSLMQDLLTGKVRVTVN